VTDTATSAGPWVTFKESPRAVRFLLLGVCVNQFGAFLQAFLVLYLTHRHFTAAQAGFALGTYGVGAVIGVILGGRLTDRLSPRPTIILSMAGSATLTVAISFLGYYPGILAVVLLAGAMTQAYRPAAAALLTGMVPSDRQVMVMAMNRLALNLGMLVGPLTAAALIRVSWNLVFWMDAATSLLYAAVAIFLLPTTRPAPGTQADPGSAPARRATSHPLLADRRYAVFLTSMLTNGLVHIQLLAVLPLTLRDAGYPTVVYSAVLVIGTCIMVSSELLVTRATQRWPAYRAAALGSLLLGMGMLGYGLRGGIIMIVAATVVNEVGQMIGGPTVFAWPAKAAPDGMAGRYMGRALAAFGLGQAIGPMLGLLAYQCLGRNFWWLCGVMGVVSALSCRFAMRPQPLAGSTTEGARPSMSRVDDPSPRPAAIGEPAAAHG
jgi:predicted MFS family arabinose efflux permease